MSEVDELKEQIESVDNNYHILSVIEKLKEDIEDIKKKRKRVILICVLIIIAIEVAGFIYGYLFSQDAVRHHSVNPEDVLDYALTQIPFILFVIISRIMVYITVIVLVINVIKCNKYIKNIETAIKKHTPNNKIY